MCFMTAAAIATGAGGIASTVGDIEGGIAQGNAAHYQAAVAANNEYVAKRNAGYASQVGQVRAADLGLHNAAVGGRIKAAQGASGIDVNTGSAVDVQAGQRQAGQLDVLTEENKAILQAYGYRTQASSFEAQSALDEAEAQQAPIAGAYKGLGDLFSAASSSASQFAAAAA